MCVCMYVLSCVMTVVDVYFLLIFYNFFNILIRLLVDFNKNKNLVAFVAGKFRDALEVWEV